MNLKNATVIVNDQGQFLDFNLRGWTTTDGHFFYGTWANAVRVAWGLGREQGRRVFVVTDYGSESERWQEVAQDGGIGKPTFPNKTTGD
jgi:hypothetical protein